MTKHDSTNIICTASRIALRGRKSRDTLQNVPMAVDHGCSCEVHVLCCKVALSVKGGSRSLVRIIPVANAKGTSI